MTEIFGVHFLPMSIQYLVRRSESHSTKDTFICIFFSKTFRDSIHSFFSIFLFLSSTLKGCQRKMYFLVMPKVDYYLILVLYGSNIPLNIVSVALP